MARVPMIEERDQAAPDQVETFDHIAASRGKMIPPYAAMLHRPEIAKAAADLGAVIRYQGMLSDHDRELVIVTTAVERECRFEWESHRPLARAAGVSEATLEQISRGVPVDDPSDAVLVDFVRESCRAGTVAEATFERARSRLGDGGVVELAAAVGYYVMLALFMNVCDVC